MPELLTNHRQADKSQGSAAEALTADDTHVLWGDGMNYIWQPLIEAIETGYDTTKIRYRLSERIFYDDLESVV